MTNELSNSKDESMDIRDYMELENSFTIAKEIITKDYLYKLEEYRVCDVPDELKKLDITEYTRLYRFKKLVSDKKENTIDKMVTVLNAAYSCAATVITLIKGEGNHTDYYIGIVSKDASQEKCDIGTQSETFRSALIGNFPGLSIEKIKNNELEKLNKEIFVNDYITSVSGIASLRNDKERNNESFVQGMEHLVDSLQGRKYSLLIIADPVSPNELAIAKSAYETLYSNFYPFLHSSLSMNESESFTVSHSQTESLTKTIGKSTSFSQGYSHTDGWSESFSRGTSKNKSPGAALAAVGAVAGIALTGGAALPVVAAAAGLGMGIGGSIGNALIGSKGETYNENHGRNGSDSTNYNKAETQNEATAKQKADTKGESESNSHGRTLQVSTENKTIKNILNRIDKNVERLEKCEAFGAFNYAAYVISPDPETNAIVANGYNALTRGDNSALQAAFINNWRNKSEGYKNVKEYLMHFSHPQFYKDLSSDMLVTPASLSNSYETAVSMALPKRSISGLPVSETAAFGRNIYDIGFNDNSASSVPIGKIYHMGNETDTNVLLNTQSLAMHTFITGSTGSGKSQTVYQILRELKNKKISFLVIEPAKGEYKHVFGSEVNVFGTNKEYTPLLRINPFRFPRGIHVLEHIDRLVEIFNVCWPMYAAMPAVLKDAIEKAYISAGWDLNESENIYCDTLFPTFDDVLIQLNKVIDESAFSDEVKDNYKGSLVTRLRSLTNGIYGRIFRNNEIGDVTLFDESAVIDISRVGSIETKSMIMGVLVMRLQEYRMTSENVNAQLHHVTVLEEAHNLLKRTSTEQSSENSNLLGKSVEMLSNAIAEMRTYGEGFIIADQAPGLLDMSVIRNTNTKIIMRLPDEEDRRLVGKAENLNDEQISELAKLPTGIGAVYQNNWLESVLCKITYEENESDYRYAPIYRDNEVNNDMIILTDLLHKSAGEKLDMNTKQLVEYILGSSLSAGSKIDAIKAIRRNGNATSDEISGVIYDLVMKNVRLTELKEAGSIEEWKDLIIFNDKNDLSHFSDHEQNRIIEYILLEQQKRFDLQESYVEKWHKYLDKAVIT